MIITPLCTLLGIERPILNASMAGTATGELAAAVSEAGGFGMIGGTNPDGASWLREQIRIRVESVVDRRDRTLDFADRASELLNDLRTLYLA